MENKFNYEYQHWGANMKVMELIVNKKNPESLRLREKWQEFTKPGTLRFKSDINLNRKVWDSRRPDKRRTDKVTRIDLELLFRNNDKNRCGEVISSLTNQGRVLARKKNGPENVSSTEESEVVKPSAKMRIVHFQD